MLLVRAFFEVVRAGRRARNHLPGTADRIVAAGSPPGSTLCRERRPVSPERAAAAVDRLGSVLLGSDQCLAKALALRSLLARRGMATTLHIGTRADGPGWRAHAWLEYDGSVLIGRLPDLHEYSRFVPAARKQTAHNRDERGRTAPDMGRSD